MYTAISTKPPLRRFTIRPLLCKPFPPPPLFSSLPLSDPSTLDSLPHRFHLHPRGALIAPPLAASHFTIISWVMGSRCARARTPPRQSPMNARAYARSRGGGAGGCVAIEDSLFVSSGRFPRKLLYQAQTFSPPRVEVADKCRGSFLTPITHVERHFLTSRG